jgi:hypothetical protein
LAQRPIRGVDENVAQTISRLALEWMPGGVTRSMVREMCLPDLMSL